MASTKTANSAVKREYPRDNRKLRNNDGRNDQFYMLLSTTYGLNISYTKKIHVGLQTTNEEGALAPQVKISGNYADGICFDVDSWREFQENMELMGEYLSGESKLKPNPVAIKNITINFTSAYGARSLLLAYKENEEEHAAENTSEEAADAPSTAKKRRTYGVAIVMQRITFQGLENM